MAERRSTYVFKNESDYEDFKNAIYYDSELNCCYHSNDMVYFYGKWGSEYRIDICSDCPNPKKVASFAFEHNGEYVANP